MSKNPKNIRITLDMMRRAKKALRKSGPHPCSPEIDRAMNALEAVEHRLAAARKYVKDMDDCLEYYRNLKKTKRNPSTIYYLSHYVDQKKHPKNTNWT